MKKLGVKFCVDIALFTDVCAIAAVGLLLALAAPDGRSARGANYLLGLHRHAWRDIHLSLSLVLVVLLSVHLWFNWTWITGTAKRYFGQSWQRVLWCVAGGWVLVLVIAWIVTV